MTLKDCLYDDEMFRQVVGLSGLQLGRINNCQKTNRFGDNGGKRVDLGNETF